jgi:hypothetical protein
MSETIENLSLSAEHARECIHNVFHHTGGWMKDDVIVEADSFPNVRRRYSEMRRTTQLVFPSLAVIYHKVLLETGEWMLQLGESNKRQATIWIEQSIKIADIVADGYMGIYESFTPAQLQDLLQDIHRSSVKLLQIKGTAP